MSTSPTTQPQPLPLTAPIWIGLGLVVLLMVSRLAGPGGILSPEPRMQRLSLQVQRHAGGSWRFEELGIEVDLPDGWIYLQVAGIQPTIVTFAHPRSNSIVRLVPNVFDPWPPQGVETTSESYGELTIEWIELATPRQIAIASTDGQATVIAWDSIDPRRIGRIEASPTDLVIVAVTHQAKGELNDAVRAFCKSIELIGGAFKINGV